MTRLSSLSVEGLRSCVRPEYAGIPSEDLEQIVDASLDELPSDVAENFLQTLGSLGKAVAPTLQRIAPGVAQGALSGATVGGPWGALIGAGAGLASGVLGGQAKPPRPAPHAPAVSIPPSAPTPSDPSAAPALPTGQGAAATLLGLFQNPTIQQALLSQVLGLSGAQQVSTASGTPVPRAAVNSLLTQLLANATESLPESESIAEQSYLQGDAGEYLIDPASPEQQAAHVLSRVTRSLPAVLPFDAVESLDIPEWLTEDFSVADSENWQEADESGEAVEFY